MADRIDLAAEPEIPRASKIQGDALTDSSRLRTSRDKGGP